MTHLTLIGVSGVARLERRTWLGRGTRGPEVGTQDDAVGYAGAFNAGEIRPMGIRCIHDQTGCKAGAGVDHRVFHAL
ncbi:MAG: hypothetical protein DWH84_04275 [Planctomycetota bacterium]|nr:MAG: hypothetical protein DWH84_04275 [Planctomycetota bacterium]